MLTGRAHRGLDSDEQDPDAVEFVAGKAMPEAGQCPRLAAHTREAAPPVRGPGDLPIKPGSEFFGPLELNWGRALPGRRAQRGDAFEDLVQVMVDMCGRHIASSTLPLPPRYFASRTNVLCSSPCDALRTMSPPSGQRFSRPAFGPLLLSLPGEPEVEALEKHETWETYGLGSISGNSVGAGALSGAWQQFQRGFLTRGPVHMGVGPLHDFATGDLLGRPYAPPREIRLRQCQFFEVA
jgi:hypothetical protein